LTNWFEKQVKNTVSMIPNALLLDKRELKERLDWIDSEIAQLSNAKGVGERIQGLKYARAQLIATLDIRKIMYKVNETD
jgi:hypothetical protein